MSERLVHTTETTSMKIHLKKFILSQVILMFALACFALAPKAQAVCQEGCSFSNTFLGEDALILDTGYNNTAVGDSALTNNAQYSFDNTALGYQALYTNSYGIENTAAGAHALYSNSDGIGNTALGDYALFDNTFGNDNTATGASALEINSTGYSNTATGAYSLRANTIGSNNTAMGNDTLYNNSSGSHNIALGDSAGLNLTTGSNNIDIGNTGHAGESNTIRIGTRGVQNTTVIAGIRGITISGGIAVMIDVNGRLGTTTSSERFKEAIKPMDKASEAILALKPVTFRYKRDLDPAGIPQFGLVAEQVEKVNPDLVARDEQGKPYTVRYEAVNAMLLNEFLKEHRKVEALQASFAQQQKESRSTAAQQQNEIKALAATVKEQAAQIQKVSAQLEANKPAPQVVVNDQ